MLFRVSNVRFAVPSRRLNVELCRSYLAQVSTLYLTAVYHLLPPVT